MTRPEAAESLGVSYPYATKLIEALGLPVGYKESGAIVYLIPKDQRERFRTLELPIKPKTGPVPSGVLVETEAVAAPVPGRNIEFEDAEPAEIPQVRPVAENNQVSVATLKDKVNQIARQIADLSVEFSKAKAELEKALAAVGEAM
jgi:hypothetical protein